VRTGEKKRDCPPVLNFGWSDGYVTFFPLFVFSARYIEAESIVRLLFSARNSGKKSGYPPPLFPHSHGATFWFATCSPAREYCSGIRNRCQAHGTPGFV